MASKRATATAATPAGRRLSRESWKPFTSTAFRWSAVATNPAAVEAASIATDVRSGKRAGNHAAHAVRRSSESCYGTHRRFIKSGEATVRKRRPEGQRLAINALDGSHRHRSRSRNPGERDDAVWERTLIAIKLPAAWKVKPKPAHDRQEVIECRAWQGRLHLHQSATTTAIAAANAKQRMRVMDRVKEPRFYSAARWCRAIPRRQEQTRRALKGAAARHRADAGGQGRRRVVGLMQREPEPKGTVFRCKFRKRRPSGVRETWCCVHGVPSAGKCSTPRRLRALPSRQWPGRAGNHRCQSPAPVDSHAACLFTHPAGDRRRPCRWRLNESAKPMQ